MREFFRDYGPAVGPTLAFVLGLVAIALKHAFDNMAARWDAERRVKKIIAMVRMSPPPDFQGPPAALSHVDDVMANMLNMHTFFDRLVAIKGAMDAADKPVHEHARPETIIRYQRIRFHFDVIQAEKSFFRKGTGSDVPVEDNFFNIRQSWLAMLASANSSDETLAYKTRPRQEATRGAPPN